jgi:uncharacterized coiled-coil DUF342 family protein
MGRLEHILYMVDVEDPNEVISALLRDREDILREIERVKTERRANRRWANSWKHYAWVEKRRRLHLEARVAQMDEHIDEVRAARNALIEILNG